MSSVAITLILLGLGLGSVAFFFTGLFDICIDALLRLSYRRHQRIRQKQRPGRIFLIRHGESEANVDPSK